MIEALCSSWLVVGCLLPALRKTLGSLVAWNAATAPTSHRTRRPHRTPPGPHGAPQVIQTHVHVSGADLFTCKGQDGVAARCTGEGGKTYVGVNYLSPVPLRAVVHARSQRERVFPHVVCFAFARPWSEPRCRGLDVAGQCAAAPSPVLPVTLARTPSVLHPVPLMGPTSARSHSTQQKAEGLPRWPTAFASSAEGCLVTRRVPDRPQAEVRAAGLARHVQQQQHRRLLSQK